MVDSSAPDFEARLWATFAEAGFDAARLGLHEGKDAADARNVILEIRAGTGGDEAAIFAGDLFRMYQRYAASKGWRVELISASEGEHGGFKEVIANIYGAGAFAHLKFESGVHRVQRVPVNDTKIQTSAASVIVMPEAEEVEVEIDRQRVADLGLDISVIGRTLETLLGGRDVSTFQIGSEQYDVTVALPAAERTSPETLASIFVRGKNGEMVQLSNIVKAKMSVAPRDLRRFNQLRAITIQANLAPGYTLGEAIAAVNQAAAETLPSGTITDLTGQAREFRDASSNLALVFVMALAFIYLVLSAQFESFRDPIMIMVSVPLSMTGALAALWFTGGTLNVYSQIGLVTLIGLITKHGILIVEFANQLRHQGQGTLEAVVEAASLRLRPILMTTGAMVLGAVPLALASGAGAESRQQIGWVIVGGMSLGTVLTIFVVPTMYLLFARDSVPGAIKAEAKDEPAAHTHGDLIAK